MAKTNNIFYASLVFGAFYFPFAALFYTLSGQCLMYKSNKLYRFLIMLRHGDWYEQRLRKTLGYLDIRDETRVLEVGCGAGKFSKRLLRAGADLKAIDVNRKFIDRLREHSTEAFDLCSVTDLSYKDSCFDRVIMFDVLHHLPDDEAYEKALSEIKRVLKPEGYAIIWEGSDSSGEELLPAGASRWVMRALDGDTNPTDIHEFQDKFKLEELEPHCFQMGK